MDAKPLASLNIDPRLIQEIAQTTMESMVAQSLGDPSKLIQAVVANALNVKVQKDGSVGSYSSDNDTPFIDAIAGNIIRQKAQEVIREFLAQKADKIKAAVKKELESRDRQKSIAKAILNATEEAVKQTWNFTCNVSFNK